ncbi:MAG: RNA 2',3'-cyclic phosphodiesterase [Oceanospirillaceae bacterium]
MKENSDKSSTIRTFFALRLRDPVARQLANCADSLAVYDKKVEVEWVDSNNYHLTLCFLGDLTIDKVEQMTQAAKKYLSQEQSLNIHLAGIESYQSASNWTLIAAKTSTSPALDALHSLVVSLAEEAGILIYKAGFNPHITLGRIGQNNSFVIPQQWPLLDLYSLADAVVLFQSKPGGRGSIYTPLATVELRDIA